LQDLKGFFLEPASVEGSGKGSFSIGGCVQDDAATRFSDGFEETNVIGKEVASHEGERNGTIPPQSPLIKGGRKRRSPLGRRPLTLPSPPNGEREKGCLSPVGERPREARGRGLLTVFIPECRNQRFYG